MSYDFMSNNVISEDMQLIYSSGLKWDKLYDSTVYISGGTGMIASYMVYFLIWLNENYKANIKIYAGVRNVEKAVNRFGDYINKPYFNVCTQDINKPIILNEKVDYIIHAASLASPQYYGVMPVETILPNVIGTNELLKMAIDKKIKSMIFFSSGNVYGAINSGESIGEENAGVLDFNKTGNFYGESKRCGESICKAYAYEYEVPVKIARVHHTYGPTLDYLNDKRVFSEFVSNILQGQDIQIKSSGGAKRAFCYITDMVKGLFCVLLEGEKAESYNIGNSKEYITISTLAEKLVKLFPEKGLKVIYSSREDSDYSSTTADRTIPLNTAKIESLGWTSNIDVEEGFYRTIKAIDESS